jgi:hypothetical protein
LYNSKFYARFLGHRIYDKVYHPGKVISSGLNATELLKIPLE